MTEKEWIKKILPAALAASRRYGYLLSVLLGQVCQETGYGTRPLVRYNNIIGMKAKLLPYQSEHWSGRVIVTGTWEEIDGAHVDKDDAFRRYNSFEECLLDYCQFMRDGEIAPGRYKYRDVLSIKNPETLIRTVNARGYATDSNYAPAVLDIIKKHNLTQYDERSEHMHYISNCGHDERGRYSGGQAGDQTGTEWEIKEWYSRPWDVVLEPPTQTAADTIAEMAIEAAHNEFIGYDQGERTTFDRELGKVNWPKDIRTKCETDCSAGVAAIVRATGRVLGDAKMAAVSKDAYTGNLEAALTAAGFIAHRGSKWTDSPDYIGNGWILLYTGHHTAVSVSDGAKYQRGKKEEKKEEKTERPLLKKGSKGDAVKEWQTDLMLLGFCDCQDYLYPARFIDGDFGGDTEKYTKYFQRAFNLKDDGEAGTNSWPAMEKAVKEAKNSKATVTAEQFLAICKERTSYYRTHAYTYGSPAVAPHHLPGNRETACDRFVDEALFRAGLKDIGNREVKKLYEYLTGKGGTVIKKESDLKAGDIVFTRGINHVFVCAGKGKRYDCGRPERISGKQPTSEGIADFTAGVRMFKDAAPAKQYRVQAGLYKIKANAEAQAERLRKAGFDVLIIEEPA